MENHHNNTEMEIDEEITTLPSKRSLNILANAVVDILAERNMVVALPESYINGSSHNEDPTLIDAIMRNMNNRIGEQKNRQHNYYKTYIAKEGVKEKISAYKKEYYKKNKEKIKEQILNRYHDKICEIKRQQGECDCNVSTTSTPTRRGAITNIEEDFPVIPN